MQPSGIEEIFRVSVGRNGDTIRALTRQSKARIVIDKSDKRNEALPVVIGLTGTTAAIDTAKVCYLDSCIVYCVPTEQRIHFSRHRRLSVGFC